MNQSTCFGSPAVNPACPKIRVEQSGIGPSGTDLQASSKTRVTARPPTRANQLRHHGTTAYKPKHGRDIGLRCHRFHVVPLLFVATNSRKIKSPDAHKRRRLSFSFRPSPIIPVRLALAHFFTNRYPDFPFHTFTKLPISRRETNFSS
jgi:hypothetical protein